MRLLYFHQHFSTPAGAVGTRSYEMARRMVSQGHEVLMVCGSNSAAATGLTGPFVNGKRRGWVDGIEVAEFDLAYSNHDGLPRRAWIFLRFALQSMSIALGAKADVVFATTTPLTSALPGIAARWLRNRPFVFEVRDLWPELPKAMGAITNPAVLGLLGALEWVAYKSATQLVGLSPGIVDGIARHGVPRERITLVPNGCDLQLFQGAMEPWRPTGVADDDLLAIFTGTHGDANGLNSVLDAALELKARGAQGIKLVLVGDGKQKPALMARAEKEGLGDVLLFHAPVAKTRLAGLMAGADVGLQILADVPAFYYGTSPNKFFDYAASGLFVLTNYPGWVADLLTESGAGCAVPPGDSAAFADALEDARDRKRAGELDREPSLRLASRFDREVLASKWMSVVMRAARLRTSDPTRE
ncbi:glycosyltransferase family 4 protein [Brevundimonas sp.]|uniref:glycosyltransferase family 4 protein n=1 Tax=Brevundimonas sp. TaxID=1871086 RepID=UPI0035AE6540